MSDEGDPQEPGWRNRTVTLRLGTLIWLVGIVMGGLGGFLVRHDVQVVTQAGLRSDVDSIKLQGERTNAYVRSIYMWAVRVSNRNGWQEPMPADEMLLPMKNREGVEVITPALADDNGDEAPR